MPTLQFPQLKDRDWLYERYVVRSLSASAIAQEIGCSKHIVYRALKFHGIESRKRTGRFPQLLDADWLREHYVEKAMTMQEIAGLVGTSTSNVLYYLKHAGISTGQRRSVEGKVVRRPSESRNAAISKTLQEQAARGERSIGEGHPNWQGGRVSKQGYVLIYAPSHPRATAGNPYIQEHVLVAEEMLGRHLEKDEVVHHRNHIRDDNRPENLEVKRRGEHTREHWAEGRKVARMTAAFETVVMVSAARIAYLESLLDANNIPYTK